MSELSIKYIDSVNQSEYSKLYAVNYNPVLSQRSIHKNIMPDVRGMGLKDAHSLLENSNVKVVVKGRGKVRSQSLEPGKQLTDNQSVVVELK